MADDESFERERLNERIERSERLDLRERNDVSSLFVGLPGGVVTVSDGTTFVPISSISIVVERGEGTLDWKDLGRTRLDPRGVTGWPSAECGGWCERR